MVAARIIAALLEPIGYDDADHRGYAAIIVLGGALKSYAVLSFQSQSDVV